MKQMLNGQCETCRMNVPFQRTEETRHKQVQTDTQHDGTGIKNIKPKPEQSGGPEKYTDG